MSLLECSITFVTALPVFTTRIQNVTEVPSMEDVRFYCKGEGEPEVTYEWFYTNGSGNLRVTLNI